MKAWDQKEGEKEEKEHELRPMASFMPPVSDGPLRDLLSSRAWGNHVIWRAAVSDIESENAYPPKESPHLIPDHRRHSFRVTERYNWSNGRDTLNLATRSDTGWDPYWQHDRCVVSRLRYGYGDGRTHQPDGDDGHRVLWTLSSRASGDLHLLPTHRGLDRRGSRSHGTGQATRARDPQRRLLDRAGWGSQRLASSRDRVHPLIRSPVRGIFVVCNCGH